MLWVQATPEVIYLLIPCHRIIYGQGFVFFVYAWQSQGTSELLSEMQHLEPVLMNTTLFETNVYDTVR